MQKLQSMVRWVSRSYGNARICIICFLPAGVTFSKDSRNLRATHSYKFHPHVQAKAVDVVVQVRDTGKGPKPQIVVRHRSSASKPKSVNAVVRASGYASAAKAIDVAASSRPDLRSAALQHYTALQKAQPVKASKAA